MVAHFTPVRRLQRGRGVKAKGIATPSSQGVSSEGEANPNEASSSGFSLLLSPGRQHDDGTTGWWQCARRRSRGWGDTRGVWGVDFAAGSDSAGGSRMDSASIGASGALVSVFMAAIGRIITTLISDGAMRPTGLIMVTPPTTAIT